MIQEVLGEPAKAAIFLVLDVRPGSESAVQDVLADLAGLTRAVGFRVPDDQLSCVAGIGASLPGAVCLAPDNPRNGCRPRGAGPL